MVARCVIHFKPLSVVLKGLLSLQLLRDLAGAANLKTKIGQMFAGEHLNVTEDRAVLHPALRAPRDEVSSNSKPVCLVMQPALVHTARPRFELQWLFQ